MALTKRKPHAPMLTIVHLTNERTRDGNRIAIVKCDCGKITKANLSYVKTGRTKSCGCLKKYPTGTAIINEMYTACRDRSLNRGQPFTLTRKEFENLIQQPCHYCGASPRKVFRRKHCNNFVVCNGLDRKVNHKGYSKRNALPCCRKCNIAKQQMSVREFLNLCTRVVNHMARRINKK